MDMYVWIVLLLFPAVYLDHNLLSFLRTAVHHNLLLPLVTTVLGQTFRTINSNYYYIV
jgi:hypothetical protein